MSYFLLCLLTIHFKFSPFSRYRISLHFVIDLVPVNFHTTIIMSLHSYNMNFSSTQGESQEPFEEASNTMVSISDISEFAELEPLCEGLEAFTAGNLLDSLSRDGPCDYTSLNPGNAPPTLGFPGNLQIFNGGSNHPNNGGLR